MDSSGQCYVVDHQGSRSWFNISKMVESWQGSLSCYFQTRNANVIEKKDMMWLWLAQVNATLLMIRGPGLGLIFPHHLSHDGPRLRFNFSKMVESLQGSLSCYFQTRNANVKEKKT